MYLRKKIIYIFFLTLIFTLFAIHLSCTKPQKSLIVYCGSGLKVQMEKLKTAFEKKYDIKIKIIDSGIMNLLEVMQETQKGDLFFYPSLFNKQKLSNFEQNRFFIGVDKLIIAIPKENPKKIISYNDLTKDGLKITVGDPAKTITGKLFERIITNTAKKDAINKNIIFKVHAAKEMINLLTSKEADVAILFDSMLKNMRYKDFKYIEFPPEINADLTIYLSELSFSDNKKNARLFSDFVRSEGKQILQKQGVKIK